MSNDILRNPETQGSDKTSGVPVPRPDLWAGILDAKVLKVDLLDRLSDLVRRAGPLGLGIAALGGIGMILARQISGSMALAGLVSVLGAILIVLHWTRTQPSESPHHESITSCQNFECEEQVTEEGLETPESRHHGGD